MADNAIKSGREEAALMEIGATRISPRLARAMTAIFLVMIWSVPAIQHVLELSQNSSVLPACYDIFESVGRACGNIFSGGAGVAGNVVSANSGLTCDLRNYETMLEENSEVNKFLRPVTQLALYFGGVGNRQVYVGNNGWLFYKPDVDYVIGRGFLEPPIHPAAGKIPEPRQTDPVKAIVRFNEQLAGRGITLIVMPTPNKAMLRPEMLAISKSSFEKLPWGRELKNPSQDEFFDRLDRAGVKVFDPTPILLACNPVFMTEDTHWTFEAANATAKSLTDLIGERKILSATRPAGYVPESETLSGTGDLRRMLCLPDWFPYPVAGDSESENNKTIVCDSWHAVWKPEKEAEILLLGDSFSSIFSNPAMGWGRAGGLAELLSLHLDVPVDAIRINDNGAWATRQALADELTAGHDRLSGKKIVIWQFADRELAFGDWRLIDLAKPLPRSATAGKIYVPQKGTGETVTATVVEVGMIPRPRSVPYANHITWIRLADVSGVEGSQAVVYMWSMRNYNLVGAATLKVGQTVKLRLKPWDDLYEQLKLEKRSDPGESNSASACWGELETGNK